jgi:hypothetical protein
MIRKIYDYMAGKLRCGICREKYWTAGAVLKIASLEPTDEHTHDDLAICRECDAVLQEIHLEQRERRN